MKKPTKAMSTKRQSEAASAVRAKLKRATISETKNHLSALLDRVRHGESITIVDRDQPVARLVPVATTDAAGTEGRLQALERAGLLVRGTNDLAGLLLAWEPVRPQSRASLLEALVAERREDRHEILG